MDRNQKIGNRPRQNKSRQKDSGAAPVPAPGQWPGASALWRSAITNMKPRLIAILLCLISVGVLFATNTSWHEEKKQNPELLQDLQLALDALKPRGTEFYCLSAQLKKTNSGLLWEYYFESAEGKAVIVSVDEQSKAVVISEIHSTSKPL